MGRLANLRMADRAFMPVVVHIALPFGCGIGVVCHWDFYFRGAIVAAGTGIVGFQAFRCTGSRLGIVVNKVVAEGVTVGCITAAALCLCRAGGGAAGMNMGQVYPIILLLDLAVTGIRCEVAFIYVRDRMRPFSRGNFYGRILCCSDWGGGGYADAACASQGLFDGNGSRAITAAIVAILRQVHIVRIVIACAALRIALPVAGNVNIAADNHGTSNINSSAISLCAISGNTAAVDANVIAGRVYSSAIACGMIPGNAAAVHGEIFIFCITTCHVHSATVASIPTRIRFIVDNTASVHSEGRTISHIHPSTARSRSIPGDTAIVHNECVSRSVCSSLQIHTTASCSSLMGNFPHTAVWLTIAEREIGGIGSGRCLYYGTITCTHNCISIEAKGNFPSAILNLNPVIQREISTQIVRTGGKYVGFQNAVVFPFICAYVQFITHLMEFCSKGHAAVVSLTVSRVSTVVPQPFAERMAVAARVLHFRRGGDDHHAEQGTQAQGQGQE